jgi:hypothetical protein
LGAVALFDGFTDDEQIPAFLVQIEMNFVSSSHPTISPLARALTWPFSTASKGSPVFTQGFLGNPMTWAMEDAMWAGVSITDDVPIEVGAL